MSNALRATAVRSATFAPSPAIVLPHLGKVIISAVLVLVARMAVNALKYHRTLRVSLYTLAMKNSRVYLAMMQVEHF
jgi:hypothetical protein